jgi:hypothetical protein
MRQARSIPLDQVPPIPDAASASPSGTSGDVIYQSGVHRWRKDRNGKLLYYIRYATERLDRQEARYEAPRG